MLQLGSALRGCLQGRQLLLVYAQLQGRCAGLLCTHVLKPQLPDCPQQAIVWNA